MADPISIAASLISILTLAGGTCRQLSEYFTRIARVPATVRHCSLWLTTLASTFDKLKTLGSEIRLYHQSIELPEGFNGRLRECTVDLQAIERRVGRVRQNLGKNRVLCTWTRVKYTILDERCLQEFFQRLQMYQSTFSLDLHIIQTQLILFCTRRHTFPSTIAFDQSYFRLAIANENRLVQPFQKRNIARTESWRTWEVLHGTYAFWSGHAIIQRWTKIKPSSSEGSVPMKCYGFAILFRLHQCGFGRGISISLGINQYSRRQICYSIKWKLSFPIIVPNSADVFRYTQAGNLAGVRSIFQKGEASPHDLTLDGTSLLHVAARNDSTDMIKFLLQQGADINLQDDEGNTPLHIVLAEGRSYGITGFLIQHGADLGNRNAEGKTPLHTFFNPVTASIIIRHPEALKEALACDNYGMTVLHYIAWSSKSGPEHISPYSLTNQMCLFEGADHEGRTALHFACQRGNVAILKYLFLHLDIDIEIRRHDKLGRTALHYAVQSKRTEVIDLVFSRGANIRAVDSKGRTVLHHAAMRNNLAAVKRVMELGGNDDLISVDMYGLNPAALAHRFRLQAVVEYLDTLNVDDARLSPSSRTYDTIKNIRSPHLSRQRFIFDSFFFLIEWGWMNHIGLVLATILYWIFLLFDRSLEN